MKRQPSKPEDPILTLPEFAAAISYSHGHVKTWAAAHEINGMPVFRPARRSRAPWRIKWSEGEKWLREGTRATYLAGLTEILAERDINQSDLADALGVDSSTVSVWTHKGTPPMARLVQLAILLRVPLDVLVFGRHGGRRFRRLTEEQRVNEGA